MFYYIFLGLFVVGLIATRIFIAKAHYNQIENVPNGAEFALDAREIYLNVARITGICSAVIFIIMILKWWIQDRYNVSETSEEDQEYWIQDIFNAKGTSKEDQNENRSSESAPVTVAVSLLSVIFLY